MGDDLLARMLAAAKGKGPDDALRNMIRETARATNRDKVWQGYLDLSPHRNVIKEVPNDSPEWRQWERIREIEEEHGIAPGCNWCAAVQPRGGEHFKRCTRCGVARYCGKPCQAADWPGHKAECSRPANKKKTYSPGTAIYPSLFLAFVRMRKMDAAEREGRSPGQASGS
ncbi:hypothetical protein DFJ74DRAFT_709398 [Hyaloraphidium curvatum]|nr:hypothetical protein DFJ74DRAFT_709398 [Hyaloraphidium curvatum]